MNLTWNLDGLYQSFEDEAFVNDLKKCTTMAENWNLDITALLESDFKPVDIIETFMLKAEGLQLAFAPIQSFASLSFSANSKNTTALKTIQTLQSLQSLMVEGSIKFQSWLCNLENLDSYIESSEFLTSYKNYFEQIKMNQKYKLDETQESIISQMRQTGSKAWETLQKKTSSSIVEKVMVDGQEKELPLQQIRNLAFEKDAALRKAGFEAEMKAYKKHDEVSAASLNGIKGESLTLCQLRGYDSPLDKTLKNSRMKKESLDAMLSAMRDAFPKFRAYYHAKAKRLGHEKQLPFYDVVAPITDSNISMSFAEGKDLVLKQFKTFSIELHDFAKVAFDQHWIDVAPRAGKSGGAFCARVPSLKESRILLNYTGKLNNVITLAHELGHGFHNYNLFNENLFYMTSPMPLAETASIFCETIVKEAILKDASKEEKLGILEIAIQGYAQVIVDIYSRYVFETNLFEKRKHGPLAVEDIKELMRDAQKEAYGDGLNDDILHPYMWMNKTHYYIPDMDFYNFPYAFGLLFAKGLYAQYQKEGEAFVPKLNLLLSSTGKMNVEEVAQLAGIDITNRAFWDESLKIIFKEIDEFLSLV